jgi:hypothetical protein
MKNLHIFLFSTFIVFTIFTFSNCDPSPDRGCQDYLTIVNNSNKTIFYNLRTIPEIGDDPSRGTDDYKINSGESKRYDLSRGSFSECVEEFIGAGTEYFLIFDEEVLQNNTWDDIVANDMVFKRYSYTLQQMKDANYTVIITN